jgi:hypothetical protein
MNKYIHNISGSTKTYRGIEIANGEFYQIPNNLLIGFQTDISVLSDLLSEEIRTSSNGISDYSTIPIVNHNFLLDDNLEVDTEGRQIIRAAAGSKGWTYFAHPIEFQTAKFSSLYEKNYNVSDRSICSIKFYDANNAEVTDSQYEADVVKTVVLFKPNYDYEMISGYIRQVERPSTDVRVWVVGGIIELGGAYVKEFAGGINLTYIGADEELRTDGRAAKYMTKDIVGVPYQANQMQIIVRHDAGVQHKIMLVLEYFRA